CSMAIAELTQLTEALNDTLSELQENYNHKKTLRLDTEQRLENLIRQVERCSYRLSSLEDQRRVFRHRVDNGSASVQQ
ncbi:MAG: hypothetical protein MHPSP_004491, partial [Paramarteilia canceri]